MEYQEAFLAYLKYEKRFSSHTVVAYRKDLDQFAEFVSVMVGDFDVMALDPKMIRSWVVYLMEEGYSPATVGRKVSSLKSFYKYLMKEELTDHNPAAQIPVPKIRKKLPNFVEENNLHRLFDEGFFPNDFTGRRDNLVLSLLYGTGIRLSELIGLRDKDIDKKQCLIRVLGKRNKERIIPYPKEINNLIDQYVKHREEEVGEAGGKLLVTKDGKPVYEKLIYRVVKSNLSKVTSLEKKSPHVLRHSYATHLLNKGADLNAVKELLGHANLAATQVYTHTTFEKLHDIYKLAHPRG